MSLVGCPNQILDWNFSHSYSVNAIKSSQLFNQKFWCHLDLILQQSLSVLLSKYKPSAYAGATIISYPDCYNVFLGDKPCFHLVILLTCMFSKASPPGVFRLTHNIVQPWPLKWLHSLHPPCHISDSPSILFLSIQLSLAFLLYLENSGCSHFIELL